MAIKSLKSQVACYLSLNIISLNDKEPRFDSIPLVTLSNLIMALRFCLLILLPPARRYQVKVAWLVAEVVTMVAVELTRDLFQRYVLNVC